MLTKWSMNKLAHETGLDRRTVKIRLEKVTPCGVEGGDPVYYLKDFLAALMASADDGKANYDAEKTRLTKAQADQAELDLAVSRKEFLPVDVTFQHMSNLLFAVRREIEMSELPAASRDEIFRILQNLNMDDFKEAASNA